jgi:hypothetical protein
MAIDDLRRQLEDILAAAEAGDLDGVRQKADAVLYALDASRLLTTTEAAALLGIRSVNTLKLLVWRLGLPYERRGNRMMLPLDRVERLQDSLEVRGIRASDRARERHESIAELGGDGLSKEELEDLSASRPGTPPRQTK